jgi:hypothetical protein
MSATSDAARAACSFSSHSDAAVSSSPPLTKSSRSLRRDVFGDAAMDNPKERLLRFLEESIELCRSGGLSRHDVDTIVGYEFSRPVEPEIRKELGGAGCTLYAVAQVFGASLDVAVATEIERVAANKEKIRAKAAAKPDYVHVARGV